MAQSSTAADLARAIMGEGETCRVVLTLDFTFDDLVGAIEYARETRDPALRDRDWASVLHHATDEEVVEPDSEEARFYVIPF